MRIKWKVGTYLVCKLRSHWNVCLKFKNFVLDFVEGRLKI